MAERPPVIVLIGFMGAGKSCVGRALGSRIGAPAIDLDQKIEQNSGCSIAELFRSRGEAEFRQMETAALTDALQEGGVIATGGGVPMRPENQQLLARAASGGASIVYLRAPAETLLERIRLSPGVRPLIDGDGPAGEEEALARIQYLLQQRTPIYESLASCVVDTDCRSPAQVVDQIVETLLLRPHPPELITD